VIHPWVRDAVLLLFQKMHNEVKRRGVRSSEMKNVVTTKVVVLN